MTFTQKVVIVLVVAAAIIGVLYIAGKVKNSPVATTTASSTPVVHSTGIPVASMITESHNQTDPYKSYTLAMTYPQSSTNKLSDMYTFVQSAKQQFLSDYDSLTDKEAQMFPGEASAYNFTLTTRVATSTNTVTYIIETYQYEGGAHGDTTETTFTYDTSGKLVTLADVFAKPYLTTVASLARKYFDTTLGAASGLDMINSGTEATTTNFSSWYLTPSTVTFIFGEYQVAPYSAGILEFPLQKSAVESLLAPKYK
jgi:hypothetical protein